MSCYSPGWLWGKKKRGSWKICALFILCQGQPNVFDVWSAQSLQIEANMHNCPSVSYLSLSHWHTVLPQATFCWLSLFCLPACFISDPKILFWGKTLLYYVMDTSWLPCEPAEATKKIKCICLDFIFWKLHLIKFSGNTKRWSGPKSKRVSALWKKKNQFGTCKLFR